MNLKDARSRWSAGLLLITALGVGIAIYQTTSPPGNEQGSPHEASAPGPIGQELHEQAANGPPAVGASASAPMSPLEFLLNNRQRQRAATGQLIPNAPLNSNEPAQAAETASDTAPAGSPVQLGHSRAESLATEKGPRGIPMPAENLGRTSGALRNDSPQQ